MLYKRERLAVPFLLPKVPMPPAVMDNRTYEY